MRLLYAVLIILPAVGVGLLVGTMIASPEIRDPKGNEAARAETVRKLQADLAAKEDRLSGFAAELEELRAELESRDRRIEKLEATEKEAPTHEVTVGPIRSWPTNAPVDRIGPRRPTPEALADAQPSAGPESIAAPAPPVTTRPAPLFAEAYGGALSRVNWKLIGISLNELTKLNPEAIRSLDRSRRLEVHLSTSIADVKRKILIEVLKLKQDVPGAGGNGKFTDPAFVANAMLVTLKAAGQPLDAEQTRQLVKVATRFMKEDAIRRAGYDKTSFELEMLLDEVQLKARFFVECFDVLSAQQEKLLRPSLSRSRLLVDPFSEAAVFGDRVRVHIFKNENSLAADVHDAVRRLLGGDGALISLSRKTVLHWAECLPREEILAQQNTLDRGGMITTDRATAWGHLVLALLKSLVNDLPMSEERARSIRELSTLSVPVR